MPKRTTVVAVCALALAVVAIACSGTGSPVAETSTQPTTATATPSSSPTHTLGPIDIVPKPYNKSGQPICGFFTSTEMLNGSKFVDMNFAVAVGPEVKGGSLADIVRGVDVDYTFKSRDVPRGVAKYGFSSTFIANEDEGVEIKGTWYRFYEMGRYSYYEDSGTLRPSPAWDAWLATPRTVIVTVNDGGAVPETTSLDNTLTLHVRSTGSGEFDLPTSRCTVVS
ncbi:MAG TPA: hypothetical protein VH561_18665 [Micromonosporaceae bacterium]|jgi:hypothetical protein